MKTHLLTKKRALISSVAMLLVAIIALGTATFAWFTRNTEAYADGMYVRTTKVSNLEISSKKEPWGTHVDYKVGAAANKKQLMPVSTADGKNWYCADAEKGDSFVANKAKILTQGIDQDKNYNDYYFADQLNIRNAGKAVCNSVTITVEGLTGDYSRIAIVPVADRGSDTIKPIDPNETEKLNWKDYIIDNDGQAYNAAAGTNLMKKGADGETYVVDTDNVVSVTPSVSKTIDVGSMAPDEVKYFNVFVWFEGQDEQCENKNSGQDIPQLKLTVTGQAEEDKKPVAPAEP